jgi:hypothetical protein
MVAMATGMSVCSRGATERIVSTNSGMVPLTTEMSFERCGFGGYAHKFIGVYSEQCEDVLPFTERCKPLFLIYVLRKKENKTKNRERRIR